MKSNNLGHSLPSKSSPKIKTLQTKLPHLRLSLKHSPLSFKDFKFEQAKHSHMMEISRTQSQQIFGIVNSTCRIPDTILSQLPDPLESPTRKSLNLPLKSPRSILKTVRSPKGKQTYPLHKTRFFVKSKRQTGVAPLSSPRNPQNKTLSPRNP